MHTFPFLVNGGSAIADFAAVVRFVNHSRYRKMLSLMRGETIGIVFVGLEKKGKRAVKLKSLPTDI